MIAKKVRRKCINYAKASSHYCEKTLAEMCGIASHGIRLLCEDAGIEGIRVVEGFFIPKGQKIKNSHNWCSYGNKFIDITATQFGEKELILCVSNKDKRYKMSEEPNICIHDLYTDEACEVVYKTGKRN